MLEQSINWLQYNLPLWASCIALMGCTLSPNQESDSAPIDHSSWNTLVQKYVDHNGMVNYRGFIQDSLALNAYLKTVSNNHPNQKKWSENESLAYWINAYNAFTIQLILRNYPLASIKDIAGNIPFVNTAWDLSFINIEGHQYDLNDIEHGIIRPNFDEPRIHFALVCAALSCPSLRNEAYTAQKLNSQLDEQARTFFNNPSKNEISSNSIQVSKLLDWYEGDFTKNGTSLIDYVNKFSSTTIAPDAKVTYKDYNWSLNEQ